MPWRKPFYMVWISENISLFAAGMVQFALIWWLTIQTSSALFVSIAMAIALIPKAILNPLIGTIVDGADRKRIMIAARASVMACSALLLALFLLGLMRPWHVFTVLFVRALADTFHNKALIASTSLMVPDDKLTRISGINQAVAGLIMFATPALGALLLKVSSFSIILSIDIGGAILAVAPLMVTPIPRAKPMSAATEKRLCRSIMKDCKEGVSYLAGWRGAVGMLGISAITNFIMQPYFSLISIVVVKNLNGGEVEFGMLGAAIGLGFSLGGCVLGIWQGFRRKMLTSLTGILLAGLFVSLSGFAVSLGLYPTLACFFFSGFMMPFCMGPIQALVQSSARKDMQGRVFSIMESASTIMVPVSLVLAGKVFEFPGPQCWYFVGGANALIVALLGFSNRRIRNLGVVEGSNVAAFCP